jgi:hypothetical protein
MRAIRHLVVLGATSVALAACTTTYVMPSAAAPVAAQLSVERFLQAANQRDVEAMGYLFGTKDGPVMDTGSPLGCAFKKIGSLFGGNSCVKKTDVEIRMDAIASILAHDDYRIAREERVAGRESPTTRVLVNMTVQGASIPGVPFVVVQSDEGRWLVQEVDLARVMELGR